ncbi:sce7726 family protein [Pseudomonas solani]|uniref:sce7726 family protein n=1 Tax=Pseudomonas solani TaxID=2731552 RepID=UPI003F4AAC74
METRDVEIRHHFHLKKLRHYHECPNTLVIDELGIAHGKNRADIAVLNGTIHGYEIKSSKDTLSRLPEQIGEYSRCFEKVSVIAAPNHIEKLLDILPEWCGLIVATKGSKGAITFKTLRRARKNPEVDIYAMAHFLWRKEIIDILQSLGIAEKNIKASREKLYNLLPSNTSTSELTQWIKEKFISRTEWRAAGLQK